MISQAFKSWNQNDATVSYGMDGNLEIAARDEIIEKQRQLIDQLTSELSAKSEMRGDRCHYSITQARQVVSDRKQYLQSDVNLYYKWMDVKFVPNVDDSLVWYECSTAILEGLLTEGPIAAWDGDAISCITQMVMARSRHAFDIKEEYQKIIKLLKSASAAHDFSKIQKLLVTLEDER